jgi:hypothetical protein
MWMLVGSASKVAPGIDIGSGPEQKFDDLTVGSLDGGQQRRLPKSRIRQRFVQPQLEFGILFERPCHFARVIPYHCRLEDLQRIGRRGVRHKSFLCYLSAVACGPLPGCIKMLSLIA